MARPPLPDDQRRSVYVALRLTEAEAQPMQDVADAEHAGNLSAAIRALLAKERLQAGVCDAARLVVYEDGPGHLPQLVKAVWRLDGRKSSLLTARAPQNADQETR